MCAGHGLIGAHHGKGGLLEGDERHAHLRGIDNAEHHHGGIAFPLPVAAHVAHPVQNAPADDRRRRSAGQSAEQHDRGEKGVGEQPWLARHRLAGDEPQRDELGQAVIVDGGAEHENEEHHHHNGIAETLVQQQSRLHPSDQGQRQQAGNAGPDDVNENPAVQHAQENPYEIHAQRGKRFHGRQLAETEHDCKADQRMHKVHRVLLSRNCALRGHGATPCRPPGRPCCGYRR